MSELLTTQEIAALQEVPTFFEMGELRKIDTLQDIPLTEGVSVQQLKTSQQEHDDDENERKLKTNSLKRFFRLPTKKSENKFGKVNASTISSSKELSGACSKATLKSSLNCYWNSVFKQKKFRSSSKSDIELEADANKASGSVNSEKHLSNVDPEDTSVLQEIQSLQISETCSQK